MHFTGRGILLDIEGTTSSISFVYDVMFPFVRRELHRYLRDHWNEPALMTACDQLARDEGHDTLPRWVEATSTTDPQALVATEVVRLMDGDVKSTGLKQLQGIIWEEGFASGELQAHLYDDVLPAIQAWNAAGKDVRIYSSGSVQAQKLFFGHTIHGDLLPLLRGHYDTTTGGKREATSYLKIAAEYAMPPQDILFLSDVPAELEAASSAGMRTALVVRPGNAPAVSASPTIHSFSEITVSP